MSAMSEIRAKYDECMKRAATVKDPAVKLYWIERAEAWKKLAE